MIDPGMSSSKPPLDDLRIHRNPEPQARVTTLWVVLGVAVLLGASLVMWWRMHPRSLLVHAATAKALDGASDRTVLNASGYVTARREATVSSKVTGKVVEVLIEEGMKVKEGQVLARLDDTNVKAGLDVMVAQLESARTAVEETQAQLKQAELEYNASRNSPAKKSRRNPTWTAPRRMQSPSKADWSGRTAMSSLPNVRWRRANGRWKTWSSALPSRGLSPPRIRNPVK